MWWSSSSGCRSRNSCHIVHCSNCRSSYTTSKNRSSSRSPCPCTSYNSRAKICSCGSGSTVLPIRGHFLLESVEKIILLKSPLCSLSLTGKYVLKPKAISTKIAMRIMALAKSKVLERAIWVQNCCRKRRWGCFWSATCNLIGQSSRDDQNPAIWLAEIDVHFLCACVLE